jgi:hypothetical protein
VNEPRIRLATHADVLGYEDDTEIGRFVRNL